VARLLTKPPEVRILYPGWDTDYSEIGFRCFTQSLHVNSSIVPLHRLSISSLSFQIHDSQIVLTLQSTDEIPVQSEILMALFNTLRRNHTLVVYVERGGKRSTLSYVWQQIKVRHKFHAPTAVLSDRE